MSVVPIPLYTSKLTLHFNYASGYKSHFSVRRHLWTSPPSQPLAHQPALSWHDGSLCLCSQAERPGHRKELKEERRGEVIMFSHWILEILVLNMRFTTKHCQVEWKEQECLCEWLRTWHLWAPRRRWQGFGVQDIRLSPTCIAGFNYKPAY